MLASRLVDPEVLRELRNPCDLVWEFIRNLYETHSAHTARLSPSLGTRARVFESARWDRNPSSFPRPSYTFGSLFAPRVAHVTLSSPLMYYIILSREIVQR